MSDVLFLRIAAQASVKVLYSWGSVGAQAVLTRTMARLGAGLQVVLRRLSGVGGVAGDGLLGWRRLHSIYSHFVPACFHPGLLDELFHHGLDSVQHVLVASMPRCGPCIQHADIKVAVSVVGHSRLGLLRSGGLARARQHHALGILGGNDAVLLEVVDLLDELLADLLDAGADVDGHDPQRLLALLGRVGLALGLGRLDGVVGELADGGGGVDEELGQLAVDAAERVDVGGGNLGVRLRLQARGRLGRRAMPGGALGRWGWRVPRLAGCLRCEAGGVAHGGSGASDGRQ
jgi:hypothetical protein